MMKDKYIKDLSVSQEEFVLKYDSKYDCYKTEFTHWERLGAYYKSENYISHTDGNRNWFEKIYQFVKKYTIRKKWQLIKKLQTNSRLKVLDIGCGTGDFLKYAKDSGMLVQGIEPDESARNLCEQKGIAVSKSLHEITEGEFNVITLWHVLEHVKDPNVYFEFFKEKLAVNGTLLIAVPNFRSYDAQYYKEYWAAWDVPRHLWHFSKKTMKKLGTEHGFDLMHIKPMYFDSFYVSLLSESYKNGSKNILKAFYIGLKSNWKGNRTKEHSSHIYIFKKSF